MERFDFWQRWLVTIGIGIVVFGVWMALFNGTEAFGLFDRRIDPVFWGRSGPSPAAVAFQRWVYGTWGATIAGWGIFVAWMAWGPFRRRELWARSCMAAGLVAWYVLDTGISLHCGVYFNAAFNTLLLVVLGVPVAATWKDFGRRPAPPAPADPE